MERVTTRPQVKKMPSLSQQAASKPGWTNTRIINRSRSKTQFNLGSWLLCAAQCGYHNWSCDTFYSPGGTYLSQRHLGDDGQHYLFSFGGIWILLVFVQPGLEGGRWLAGGIFSTRGQVVARPIPDDWKGLTYVQMMILTHTKHEIETNLKKKSNELTYSEWLIMIKRLDSRSRLK